MNIEMKEKAIKFARTKKGIPVIWESSKQFPNVIRITCIFDENGNSKESIFNRIGSKDALIPIKVGDIIVKVFFDNDGCGVSILKILTIDSFSNKATVEVLKRKPSNVEEWNTNDVLSTVSDEVYSKLDTIVSKIRQEHAK